MTDVPPTEAQLRSVLAVQLVIVLNRIQSRLRQEAEDTSRAGTASSVAMLQRLAERGPMSVSLLAASEHVTHQAIGKRLATLQANGCVVLEADPSDRRRKVVRITDAGRCQLRTVGARQDWLTRAISNVVAEEELPALAKAVELLGRLSAADPPRGR